MPRLFFILFLFCGISGVFARGFDGLFSELPAAVKTEAQSSGAYYAIKKENTLLKINAGTEFNTRKTVLLEKKNAVILEMVTLIKKTNNINLIDIYNATLRVRLLAGRKYFSHTRRKEVPLFKKALRVEGEAPKNFVPLNESAVIILDDINLGECYYQTELTKTENGIIWFLTNSKPISFLFLTIFKKNNFNILFYIEPVSEGVAVYSIMLIAAEEFAASRVDIVSAAKKRFQLITDWLVEGIDAR
ncbi:MAG: hypothetical protein Pg6A_07430 [Termitinemataceae bacterium]|nr:MAG: hypothetical protein Pg6A_07430 [Termitinemataceae bacterium]